MDLEQFRLIKGKLVSLFEEFEKLDEEDYNNPDVTRRMEDLEKEYLMLEYQLFNSNLSQIPYQEWEGLFLFDDDELDLSNTYANIDLSLLKGLDYSTINLKGCNVVGLEVLESYTEDSFDVSFVDNHPNFFPNRNLPDDIKEKFYNKEIQFSDLILYPSLNNCVRENYFKKFSSSYFFIQAVGFDNAMKMFHESPEFISKVLFDREFYSTGISFYGLELSGNSYEDVKKQVYSKIVEGIRSKGSFEFPDLSIIPQDFKTLHPEIFFAPSEIPDEVFNDYYEGSLTLKDIRDYKSILIHKDIEIGIRSYFSRVNNISKFFGDIWNYINTIPAELDTAIINYDGSGWEVHELSEEEKLLFIRGAIIDFLNWNKYGREYNLDTLYTYSLYVPLEEIFHNNNVISFINKCGFENLYNYNRQNNYILDKKISANSNFFKLIAFRSLEVSDHPINSYVDFINYMGQVFFEIMKLDDYYIEDFFKDNGNQLIKMFPNIFLNDFELSNILTNIDDEDKDIVGNLNSYLLIGFKNNLDKILYLVSKYPRIVETLKNKNILLKDSSNHFIYNLYKNIDKTKFLEIVVKYGMSLTYIPNDYKACDLAFSVACSEDSDKLINEAIYQYIIKNGIFDIRKLPDSFKMQYSNLYLSEDCPEELKEAFYNRNIYDFILFHPDYRRYLFDLDLGALYRYIPVEIDGIFIQEGLVKYLEKNYGKEYVLNVYMIYGKYLEEIYNNGKLNVSLKSNFTSLELLDCFDKVIYKSILDGEIKYNDSMPIYFKEHYPTLFLPDNVPFEIKEKFYNRTLTVDDFNNNSELIKYFSNTNVLFGFDSHYSWINNLFDEDSSFSEKALKILNKYSEIGGKPLQALFREYVLENSSDIDFNGLDEIVKILNRLSFSNSLEMNNFSSYIAKSLLTITDSNEREKKLAEVESLFIENNVPVVGKVFSVFEILHPNCSGFDFDSNNMSPTLKNTSNRGRKMILFSDLLKAASGSNNRSLLEYLDSIEIGNKLLLDINSGRRDINNLSQDEFSTLESFVLRLNVLYNNTMAGRLNPRVLSDDIKTDINKLLLLLSSDGNSNYSLPDRLVHMFAGNVGITSFDEVKSYITKKVEMADKKNRIAARGELTLEEGDFVKGIGDVKYLSSILQNGSVCKEFLGAFAESDGTPLDTDCSRILKKEDTIYNTIRHLEANSYGGKSRVFIVLKGDDRFVITRSHNKDDITVDKVSFNQYEVFSTGGGDHYGIRTGFASSDIDYFVCGYNYDSRVGLEIAMNGFYIPVVSESTEKVIFSPEDYDNLRSKMAGLSYFGEDKYTLSNNLSTPEIVEMSKSIRALKEDSARKRDAILRVVGEAAAAVGLTLVSNIEKDLKDGTVEFIDTGSTGRGTSVFGDSDFDFMMKLDRKIISNPEELDKLKSELRKRLSNCVENVENFNGDFRYKGVSIEGLEETVDIDISFTNKTDQVSYSTDMCLRDRLSSVKKQYPDEYDLVVSNIVMAKKVLKEAGAYKPRHASVNSQGGLGGVGVENWILQNGGSFEDAARGFLQAAEGKSFSEFCSSYEVWDFGQNHRSSSDKYPHDNFIRNNMSEEGYGKMKKALGEYIYSLEVANNKSGELSSMFDDAVKSDVSNKKK